MIRPRLSKWLSIGLILAVTLAILAAAIAVPIWFRPFYYWHIDWLDLESTGWSRAEIKRAYDEMINYCTLYTPMRRENGQWYFGALRCSESGRDHFTDVRKLFTLDAVLLLVSLAYIATVGVLSQKNVIRIRRFGRRSPVFYGGLAAIVVPIAVALPASINFDRAFEVFHSIFFPGKDNWIFDWRTDEIINVMPEAFFRDCAILIGACTVLAAALCIGLDFRRRRAAADAADAPVQGGAAVLGAAPAEGSGPAAPVAREDAGAAPQPLFSVVMPVYNAASTLARTLASVFAQTYRDWELIAVDDGSTDGSAGILDDAAARDGRVTVLHVANGGVSRARNLGLDAARGVYATFLDADDELTADCLAVYAEALATADCAVADYEEFDFCRQRHRAFVSEPAAVYGGAAYLAGCFERLALFNCVWNKAYRLSDLRGRGLRFEESLDMGEDLLFNARAIAGTARVAHTGRLGYRYNVGERRLTRRYRTDRFEIHLRLAAVLLDLLSAAGESPAGAHLFLIKSTLGCFVGLYAPNCPLTRAQRRAYVARCLQEPALRLSAAYVRRHAASVLYRTAAKWMLGGAVRRLSAMARLYALSK